MSAPLLVVENQAADGTYPVLLNGRRLGVLAAPVEPNWFARPNWDYEARYREAEISIRVIELLDEPKPSVPRRRWSASMQLGLPVALWRDDT